MGQREKEPPSQRLAGSRLREGRGDQRGVVGEPWCFLLFLSSQGREWMGGAAPGSLLGASRWVREAVTVVPKRFPRESVPAGRCWCLQGPRSHPGARRGGDLSWPLRRSAAEPGSPVGFPVPNLTLPQPLGPPALSSADGATTIWLALTESETSFPEHSQEPQAGSGLRFSRPPARVPHGQSVYREPGSEPTECFMCVISI